MGMHTIGILAKTTDLKQMRGAADEFLDHYVPDLFDRWEEESVISGKDNKEALQHHLTALQAYQKIALETHLSGIDFLSFLKVVLNQDGIRNEIMAGKKLLQQGCEMHSALCLLDGQFCIESSLYSLEDLTTNVDIDVVLKAPDEWTLILYGVHT